ncbi:MAG: hypothetical protein ACO29O_09590, partial [Chitinophagaceae bacterium]
MMLSVMFASAQSLGSVELRMFPDQQVYIAGEDVWIQGDILGGTVNDSKENTIQAKMVTIQLMDRKGQLKSTIDLLLDGRKYSGYISLPFDLASDYYFLDAHIKGILCRFNLIPIMVVNGLIPP